MLQLVSGCGTSEGFKAELGALLLWVSRCGSVEVVGWIGRVPRRGVRLSGRVGTVVSGRAAGPAPLGCGPRHPGPGRGPWGDRSAAERPVRDPECPAERVRTDGWRVELFGGTRPPGPVVGSGAEGWRVPVGAVGVGGLCSGGVDSFRPLVPRGYSPK
ncbi:hypothetical protein GCM10010515_62020 [Streptomyces fructofermentans]|uniref:Uncharacterized protein n=1 Tax=Streptomyces fructofermentans TaxID=152141 RepID=A0A918NPN3_9ACTN|nr:hypothetical protein GCM10010515_62020 [Streptomyces fructofermentans]